MNGQGALDEDGGPAGRARRPAPAPGAGARRAGALAGFGLFFEGFGWLRRERSLWALALVPLGFSVLAAALALSLVGLYASELYALISDLLPVLEVTAWYQWIWLGPAKLFFWLLSALMFAVAAAMALLLGLLLANVAAAPFLDALSWRVEKLFRGEAVESDSAGMGEIVGDIGRSLTGEVQRTFFFLLIWAVLLGVGFVIPGAHLVTAPLMMAVTIVFLPLEFSGHVLDRRRVPWKQRRRWIFSNWSSMLGFGSAAFLACFVPVVNLAMMPALVVAGTLLALRQPPQAGLH